MSDCGVLQSQHGRLLLLTRHDIEVDVPATGVTALLTSIQIVEQRGDRLRSFDLLV